MISLRFFFWECLRNGRGCLEKAMATSSTLAWKIPWTEEPGRLQSLGSLGVGHDWATPLSLFTFMHWRRKWQPTPVFLPGESQGQGSLADCRLWGRTVRYDWSDLAAAANNQISLSLVAWSLGWMTLFWIYCLIFSSLYIHIYLHWIHIYTCTQTGSQSTNLFVVGIQSCSEFFLSKIFQFKWK